MIPNFPVINKEEKTIEGVGIDFLADRYGTPLLIFSKRIIIEKYRKFKDALERHYPNAQIAYSVKANYLPALVTILKQEGAWAEVVSGFEYWLVKKLGFAGDQIIFNGPDKKTSEIETALRDGAIINIDNSDEMGRTANLSKKLSKKIGVGLRINAEIEKLNWSRFGFNLDNNEAYEAIKTIHKNGVRIEIRGLHVHMGTNINEPRYYSMAAEKLAEFALKIKKDFGFSVAYLDFGGGFAVPGSRWLNSPLWVVPDIEEYIKGIADIINKKFILEKPKLIFEPGRYLVDEAGIFLTTVTNVKTIKMPPPAADKRGYPRNLFNRGAVKDTKNDKSQLINIDSSSASILRSAFMRNKLIEPFLINKNAAAEETINSYVVGNSCLTDDFVAWEISLPKMAAGDILIFYNTGAYTISRSEQFIHPRPAVILIEEGGEVKCIRRREMFEDMMALDI